MSDDPTRIDEQIELDPERGTDVDAIHDQVVDARLREILDADPPNEDDADGQ